MANLNDKNGFSGRIIRLDTSIKTLSVIVWEKLLGVRILPKKKRSDIDFLSEADRIEEEPINQNYPIVLYVIMGVVFAGLIWAALSPLDAVVSGKGKVMSVEQNIVLQPQETAEIKRVNVTIGQTIKKGEVLFVLDPTIPQADFLQTEGSYQGIVNALDISEREISTIQARLSAAKETEEMVRQLVEKNFQSRRALIEQSEKRLELEQTLLNARAKRNDLLSQRNSYQQQLIKAKRRKELIEIVAPRDGVILEVSSLTVGSVARATEPLVTIVPTDVPIMAEISIDPSNISGVSVGQHAKVKLDAFPFQRYGYIEGSIVAVSPDAIQSRVQNAQSSYIVRIKFERTDESKGLLGKIIPGMSLIGEIRTDERTVLEYIFDPLFKIKMESLNEK
jgi:multidrug efflux pump subunit AcrA (membrane-fusion protein)